MTQTDEPAVERPAFPYLSFETFRNFIDGLSGRPLPPRIDRSLMIGMAGGTQTLLLNSLMAFGLVGPNREVTELLNKIVALDDDVRPAAMGRLMRRLYAEQMTLAEERATADQLQESFRQASGYQGSTLRKAITFFLNMARYADVPLSPYFRAPAQTSRPAPARTRTPRRSRVLPATAVANPAAPMPVAQAGEARTVELVSGGTVTVSCSTEFLALSREDRGFVFDLVDRLVDYAATHNDASAPVFSSGGANEPR